MTNSFSNIPPKLCNIINFSIQPDGKIYLELGYSDYRKTYDVIPIERVIVEEHTVGRFHRQVKEVIQELYSEPHLLESKERLENSLDELNDIIDSKITTKKNENA